MIMNFLRRVPAGMMVVPLFLGCLVNTFVPDALQIGGITTATFSSAGGNCALGILLFCMGTKLRLKEMPAVLKRGGLLLVAKFAIGAILGILVGRIFGPAGILGISSMAIICAVTNSNGSVYYALMQTYGDDIDCACMPILAINDGPFLTLVALGASGLADIPIMSLVAALVPIIAGMILGNLDNKVTEFFGPVGDAIIPFTGFSLGAGIDLANVLKGGVSGIVLGLITTKSPKLEDKEKVIARIHEAEKYIPLDRLCLSPQCGFASCEIGNKLTEDEQWAKLRLVKEITEEVWE